jgi:hypothetical protein
MLSVYSRDREQLETRCGHGVDEISWRLELAETPLDSDLPNRGGADHRRAVSQRLERARAEATLFSREKPEENVRV